jgi:biopolymer transport protein ExbD
MPPPSLTHWPVARRLAPGRPAAEDPHFDITAMIDLVFMMNIYFLVTFIGAMAGEIDLPAANYCLPLDPQTATTITVLGGLDLQSVRVYLGDGPQGAAISDPLEQERQIRSRIRAAVAEGKTAVLLKAERAVRLRAVRRIAAAISEEPDVKLHLAVLEKDVVP